MTVVCLVSCGKKDDKKEPDVTAKYLSATSFSSSVWEGTNEAGAVKLTVSSTSDMTLTYFKIAIAKNTDNPPVAESDKITYTFDEITGKFTGKGASGVEYTGNLTSTTALTFNGATTGQVSMTKK